MQRFLTGRLRRFAALVAIFALAISGLNLSPLKASAAAVSPSSTACATDGYCYAAFTTVQSGGTWTIPANVYSISLLVVGGGGGGTRGRCAYSWGTGGGGGGVAEALNQAVTAGATATITVGSGGAGSGNCDGVQATAGGSSSVVVGSVSVTGGGGAISPYSGSASATSITSANGPASGSTTINGTVVAGNAGGIVTFDTSGNCTINACNAGGGGGAGAAASGMNAGTGKVSALTGARYGGGGAGRNSNGYGTADSTSGTGTATCVATANYGGGGSDCGGSAGAGGSGYVYIRYLPGPTASLANQTTTLGSTATFTASPTRVANLTTATFAYQWQVSTDTGSTWADISGATAASYTTPTQNSTATSAVRYRAKITQTSGSLSSYSYSTAATLTVNKAVNNITFNALSGKTYGDAAFDIASSASASSGLAVSFSSATTGVCTVSGTTATIVAAGTCTINANQAGDATYATATQAQQSFTVSPKALTITGNNDSKVYGSTKTYGAGSTAFTQSGLVGSETIGSVTITASGGTTSTANVGTYSLTPSAATGGTFLASNYLITYAPGTLTVTSQAPVFSWSNASTTYAPSGTYTLTAPTVTTGGAGTWAYSSSDTTVATVSSGSTLNLLKAGTTTITATFTPSSGNFTSGTTTTMVLTVAQAANPITWSQTLSSTVFGSSTISLSATAASGGSVVYSTNNSSICSVSGSTLTVVGVGSCTVTANQAGNGNYLAATAVSKTFSVTQASNSITFAPAPTGLTYGETGQTRTVSATATSGTIAYSTASSTCSVDSVTGVVTILAAGSCVITASASSVSPNYVAPANATQTLTIATASSTAATWSNDSVTYSSGATYTVTPPATSSVAVSGSVSGTWSYSSSNSTVAALSSGAIFNLLKPGAVTITGTFTPSDTSIAPTTATFTLTIGQGVNTISWNQTLGSVVFGSSTIALTASATATGAISYSTNSNAICSVTGSTLTIVGVGSCTVTANQSGDTNYTAAAAVSKTFSITQASNSITFAPAPAGLTFGETGQTRTVSATATSGTIAYSTSSSACSVNPTTGVVTILAAGSCVISAAASSVSPNYVAPSDATQTLTIAQAANTIAWTQTLGSVTFGAAPISLTATATNGTVTYSTSNGSVCSVTGSTLTIVGSGTCTVTAAQGGNSNSLAASSVAKTFVVGQASNSIVFAPAPSGLTYGETGQTRTVSATATSGTIAYSTSSSACSVNATTGVVTILAAGTCVITATASSVSSSYLAPSAQTQTLNIATASVAAGAWANTSVTYAPSATYTVVPPSTSSAAVSGSVPGVWVFASSDATVASLSSGALFNLLRTGTTTITGTFTPTDTNIASTTATFSLTVSPGNNVITFGALQAKTITSANFGVSANSSSGLAVSITSATPGICTISNGVVSLVGVGTCVLNANQAGNSFYAAASQVSQSFSVNAVVVTFNSNYGSPSTTSQNISNHSGAALTTNSFARTGYTFAGWSTSPNGSVNYTDGLSVAFTNDTTLYAVWQANSYGITYFANGADAGAVPTDNTVYNIGQSISVRSNTGALSRTGYTFAGWNTAANGSGFTYNSGNTVSMGASSVSLFAVWTPNTYLVTYNNNGAVGSPQRSGTNVSSDSYTTASNAVTLPGVGTLIKTGYTFSGWATTPSGTTISGTFTTATDVTLYAQWTIMVIAVNYSKGAASASSFTSFPANTSGNYGTRVTLSGAIDNQATISGLAHVFVGWSDGTSIYRAGDTYLLTDTPVTFVAQWVQVFGVRYTFAGGTPSGSDSVVDSECLLTGNLCTNGQSITANAAPTRAGYNFTGWVDQSGNAIAAGTQFTVSTGTYLLYATWQPINYTVTYVANGGLGAAPTQSALHYGDTFTIGSGMTRVGYDFVGWSDGSSIYGAGAQYAIGLSNVALSAVWNPHVYSIGFDWNGGSGSALASRSYTVGTAGIALPTPTNQTRDGYTFAGWSLTPTGALLTSPFVASASVILFAVWNTGSFALTFDPQNGTLAQTSAAVQNGASFSLPTPTRNNFVFTGWYSASTGGTLIGLGGANFTPTSSATLYARWVQSSLYGIAPGNLNRIGTINASPIVGSNYSGTSGSSGVSVSVPAGALPTGTVVSLDLISDTSYAQSLISSTNTYVLSVAVSWLAADGTVPDTASGKSISLTLTNPAIRAGALVYSIQNGIATLLGTATANGTVTVELTTDPGIYLVQTVSSAPRNITGVATQNSITFTWAAPSTDGGSAITAYTVTLNDGSTCSTTTALSCTISNLTPGTSYSAQLTATNSVGSSLAATASILTNSPPAPAPVIRAPGAPMSLSASVDKTTITLRWSPPADDGGSPVIGYSVSSPDGLGCSSVGTSCVIINAVDGKTYSFTVTASNSAGTSSTSASTSVTIEAPIVIPSKPVVVVVSLPDAILEVAPVTGTPVLAGVQVVKPILFNPDSAKLDSNDLKSLAAVAATVQGKQGILLITGFVKFTGKSPAVERKLATDRARAVAKAIAKYGVAVTIGYLGFGPRNKIAPKATDRKVEVRWVSTDSATP